MIASDIERVLLEHLDTLEKKERVEVIDDFLHRLNFERRLTLLMPNQIENMNCELSPGQKERILKCETEEAREEVINGYARANYFRQLAWTNYLNGHEDDPPIPPEPFPDATRGDVIVKRRRSNGMVFVTLFWKCDV